MYAELKHALRRMRNAIIGWAIGLFLFSVMMAALYTDFVDMGADMLELLDSYPPEMLAFFPRFDEITSPLGYLDTYYYSLMPIIIGVFAVTAGAGLLVRQEEAGILDILLSYPVSRAAMFWGRVAAFAITTGIFLLGGWLGWLVASNPRLELSASALLYPYISL